MYLQRDSFDVIGRENINFLLAYANWLVVLNDVADMCYFTETEVHIEVDDEYVINTLEDNELTIEVKELHKRKYEYFDGMKRNHETDISYLKKVKETFKKDTGYELEDLIDLCEYLKNIFPDEIVSEKGANVYLASKQSLISDFVTLMDGAISMDQAVQLIEYVTVNPQKLKTNNGKEDFYLPIGQRRTRVDRFELQPLCAFDDEIAFSPITLEHLYRQWIEGIMNFLLPCMNESTEHDGVIILKRSDVGLYYDYFKPAILRFNCKTLTDGYYAINFGECKGMTFERVLIYPNGVLKDFLLKKKVIGSPQKYYVGATRAKYSIAFVLDALPKETDWLKNEFLNLGSSKIEIRKYVVKEY